VAQKALPLTTAPLVGVRLVQEQEFPYNGEPLREGADVAAFVGSYLKDLDREAFMVIMLTSRNRVISANIVSLGTLDGAMVCPREVFKVAILQNAASVILVHNHPSGDPAPSEDDINITKRMVQAGQLLGIPVLDHVVVSRRGSVSLRVSSASVFL
jgi:DNA repair protein RadC